MMVQEHPKFLTMIYGAMRDEKMAADYYKQLEEITPHHCKHHIRYMMEDEIKHYKMLAHTYHVMTGVHPVVEYQSPMIPANFLQALDQAFNDELAATEHYRTIYLMTYNMKFRDMLFEIMTDEMEHATRLNHCCCMVVARQPEPHPYPPPIPYPPKG